jgi:hypothetical protein
LGKGKPHFLDETIPTKATSPVQIAAKRQKMVQNRGDTGEQNRGRGMFGRGIGGKAKPDISHPKGR